VPLIGLVRHRSSGSYSHTFRASSQGSMQDSLDQIAPVSGSRRKCPSPATEEQFNIDPAIPNSPQTTKSSEMLGSFVPAETSEAELVRRAGVVSRPVRPADASPLSHPVARRAGHRPRVCVRLASVVCWYRSGVPTRAIPDRCGRTASPLFDVPRRSSSLVGAGGRRLLCRSTLESSSRTVRSSRDRRWYAEGRWTRR
jgi:hypothetical protein